MTHWLVDTNVISELHKPRPHASTTGWFAQERKSTLFISTVTIAEIRFGIEIRRDPLGRAQLSHFLETTVRPLFEGRVVAVGEEELLAWCLLAQRAQKAGQPLPQPDSLIAAIALVHGMTVVTRDTQPFRNAGLPVFNPWTGERFNDA